MRAQVERLPVVYTGKQVRRSGVGVLAAEGSITLCLLEDARLLLAWQPHGFPRIDAMVSGFPLFFWRRRSAESQDQVRTQDRDRAQVGSPQVQQQGEQEQGEEEEEEEGGEETELQARQEE